MRRSKSNIDRMKGSENHSHLNINLLFGELSSAFATTLYQIDSAGFYSGNEIISVVERRGFNVLRDLSNNIHNEYRFHG